METFLHNLIDKYEHHIKHPFIAFRDAALHLWIPTIFGCISFILFAFIPQTHDIYRSFIEDQKTSILQIFLGTFLVFILSWLVWYSGRLLSYEYPKERGKTQTHNFKIWAKSHHNSSLRSLPKHIRRIIQSQAEHKVKLVEHLTLLYLPRLSGLLPFTGLMVGIQMVNGNIIGWFSICIVLWILLVCIFCLRRKISGETNSIQESTLDDSLFSPNAENLLANLVLFCFGALTLPIISTLSGKLSAGVITYFIFCLLINGLLMWWNSETNHLRNILSPIYLGLLVLLSGIIFLYLPPLYWPNLLGPISIAAISLSMFVVTLSTIYNWGNDYGIPAVSLILVLAFISSLIGWNNNHQIRYLANNTSADIPKVGVNEEVNVNKAFQAWFKERSDLEKYSDKDYPVYIVSAQGGGIFAAYHAATTLTKLQDEIPNFSDHVFAISGVSGGAVGSSVYASLIKEFIDHPTRQNSANPCPELTSCAQQVLGEDFLSPLFSLGLFPDLLQRFLPWPNINDWDRSRGLEVALEENWNKHIVKPNQEIQNPLSQPFYNYWQADSHTPALILNTTNVENGKRLLISPFKVPHANTLLDYPIENHSVPLSTAAGLSARFPIISSAGWFKYDDGNKTHKIRLVDGGYFDNSGIATTRDIFAALEQKQEGQNLSTLDEVSKQNSNAKPKLINIAIVGLPPENNLAQESFQGLNELVSPLLAFWKVYNNRSDKVVEQARYELNRESILENSPDQSQLRFRAFYLNAQDLPLGWLLSKTSQERIDAQNKSYKECKSISTSERIASITGSLKTKNDISQNNACVAKSIFDELSSDPEESA